MTAGANVASKRTGPGSVIAGKYRLEHPIGSGGMATVWKAVHTTLNRAVAVKFLHLHGKDPEQAKARFFREAKVAAAIRHRAVVDIIDFGTADDGEPYMVMEFIEGQTLGARFADETNPLSVPELVSICARLLSGLSAVHEAGIVHRDLKPDNIVLVRDGEVLHPKLLDFGISRSVGTIEGLRSVLETRENVIVGTPRYLSPEAARGRGDLDHRSDIYGVGVILYEGLTGQPPFDAKLVGDLITLITSSDPTPVSAIRPDLGHGLPEVVAKAMFRDRERRFQSAKEMRTELLAAARETAANIAEVANSGLPVSPSDYPLPEPRDILMAALEAQEPGDESPLDLKSVLATPKLPVEFSGRATVPAKRPQLANVPPGTSVNEESDTDRDALGPFGDGSESPQVAQPVIAHSQKHWRRVSLMAATASVLAASLAVMTGALPSFDDGAEASVTANAPANASRAATDSAGPTNGIHETAVHEKPDLEEGTTEREPSPTPPVNGFGPMIEETHAPATPLEQADTVEADVAPTPDTITITLRGLPRRAKVWVDGEPQVGTEISLPRSDEEHVLEVQAPGLMPWEATHVATENAVFVVQQAKRRTRRLRRVRPAMFRTKVYRDPGF